MLISQYFEKMVEKRYKEMKEKNISVGILAENFGKLKVFINEKPESFLFSTTIDSDEVYVGGSKK